MLSQLDSVLRSPVKRAFTLLFYERFPSALSSS